LALTTSFVKSSSQSAHGGDWVARVEGATLKNNTRPAQEISLFFYAGFLDDSESYMDDEDLLPLPVKLHIEDHQGGGET